MPAAGLLAYGYERRPSAFPPILGSGLLPASVSTQVGGRLTNYSGGTAPDSHRISFSARLPPVSDKSDDDLRTTGRHFTLIRLLMAQGYQSRLSPSISDVRSSRSFYFRIVAAQGDLATALVDTVTRLPRCYGTGVAPSFDRLRTNACAPAMGTLCKGLRWESGWWREKYPLPPDFALGFPGQGLVILGPELAAEILPAAVSQQADDVAAIQPFGVFNGAGDY